jgi:hypothetical protein
MANQTPPPGVYRDKSSTLKQNLLWVLLAVVVLGGGYWFIARLPPPVPKAKPGEEQQTSKPSTLVVTTGLPGVQVFIEQKPSGTTDDKGQLKVDLPANQYYFVEVKKEGYPDMSSNVRLGPNEEREVVFEMAESKKDKEGQKK